VNAARASPAGTRDGKTPVEYLNERNRGSAGDDAERLSEFDTFERAPSSTR
jgi:hypothetical protein